MGLAKVAASHGGEVTQLEDALTVLALEARLVHALSVGVHLLHGVHRLATEMALRVLAGDEAHLV